VGLVHNHDGTAQTQHVHQRWHGFSIRAGQQIGTSVSGQIEEMIRQTSVLGIDAPPGRILRAEGLDGGDDDDRATFHHPRESPSASSMVSTSTGPAHAVSKARR